MQNTPEDTDDERDDLYEHVNIKADKGQEPLRIDKFLMNRLESVSRNRIQQVANAELLLVNGTPVKVNYKVRPNDEITVLLTTPAREHDLSPEDIPLNVEYEDAEVVIVNKQAGLVVHPGSGNHTGTLVNALLFHFNNLPDRGDESRPGLVHRIDKNTTGLMVIAKTDEAMTFLAKQFFDHSIHRSYVALVWGDIAEDEGTIEGNVGRDQRFRKKMAVYPEGDLGKVAITHYKVLERFGYTTLVECRLETGRTHQIRVHMSHIGHPLFNDDTYGGDRIVKGTVYSKYKQFVDNCFKLCQRQALHARTLGFIHPTTKEAMQFDSGLPEDMQGLVDKWRGYYDSKVKDL